MKTGNIMVLTQWSYKDALIQTYALPYVEIIRRIVPASVKIYVVTSERKEIALSSAEVDKINLEWKQQKMFLITRPYKHFGLKKLLRAPGSLIELSSVIKRNKIKTIHAFCTPAGGIGYLLSKISGARLIIDSYEPHAETMVENGTWKKNGAAYRILNKLERRLTKKASHVIATTTLMKEYAKKRFGVKLKSFFVKPACVDLDKFSPSKGINPLRSELGLNDKIVCVFAGKLGGIYLEDEVFDFIRSCYEHWGNRFRFIMLSNTSAEEISIQEKRAGIPHGIIISRYVQHHEVPRFLELADFALNPVKPVPTKRYCTSIKDGEYWAMGLPIVIPPNISDDSDIISSEKTGVILKGFDAKSYKQAIAEMESLLSGDTEQLRSRIRKQAVKYRSFSIAENIYQQIYLV